MKVKTQQLIIIYHSQTGNTEAMAEALYEGARSTGATVTLKRAADVTGDDFLVNDRVAFGSPVYFDYMAGSLKDCFDRAFYATRDKVDNKPYVAFSTADSGGKQALDSIDRICNSFRLKKAFDGVIATGKPSSDVLEQCKELGKKLAQL